MKLVISESNGYEKDYIRKMYRESKKRLREQDVEIEVKHEGILEVPEGKNVDDLPVSHFVNLAKKKGLSKITKALNNLQVWNKKKNPSLSKWAGDMIDKVSKKMEKKESLIKLKEDSLDDIIRPEIKKRYIWPLYEDSAYEISEIIEKYRNTNRFKNEIKSFDLKDISYMDWPALQLEIECSYEAYVLIRKDLEREGLYMDDDEFDESLKLKSYRNEQLSVKDAKIITSSDKAMNNLDSIGKIQRNWNSFTEYEKKAHEKDIKKYVDEINDEIKSSKSKNESYPKYKKSYWKYKRRNNV